MKFLLFLIAFLFFHALIATRNLRNALKDHESDKKKSNFEDPLILKGKEIKIIHKIAHKMLKLCNGNVQDCQLEIRNRRAMMTSNRQKEISGTIKLGNSAKSGKETEKPQLKQKEFFENDEINSSYAISDELKQQILRAEKSI